MKHKPFTIIMIIISSKQLFSELDYAVINTVHKLQAGQNH